MRTISIGTQSFADLTKDNKSNAYILEFKVQNDLAGEKDLEDTVAAALRQIEKKKYACELLARGIEKNRIYPYGFAFCGKTVRIGGGYREENADSAGPG